jgi:transcriptional antiterminator RfaH
MNPWLVVIAKPRAEAEAEAQLRAKGYDAYCPKLVRWATHARRREKKSYPLFPRYLFVRLGQGHSVYEVRATEGVNNLIRNADGPLSVNHLIIEQLMTAETLGHFDQTQDPKPLFEPGQPVRVISGPFLGFAAKV